MKSSHLLAIALLVPLAGCLDKAADSTALKLESLEDKASYSFGVDFATRLNQQNITLNTDALVQGIRDGSAGAETLLSEDDMSTARTEYLTQLRDETGSQTELQKPKKTSPPAKTSWLKMRKKKAWSPPTAVYSTRSLQKAPVPPPPLTTPWSPTTAAP